MNHYRVKVRVRGTTGKRATATLHLNVYANNHGDAVERAKSRLTDAAIYEVRNG